VTFVVGVVESLTRLGRLVLGVRQLSVRVVADDVDSRNAWILRNVFF